jgi:transcriptional regulator with PAS, ATPase and Fis domain
MKPSHNRAHVILTVNGVQGACAAALVLQKYREARIRLTSPRHLPAALNELADARFRGTVHLCGIDAAEPVEDLLPSLDGLAASAQIIWYGGKNHAGLARRAPALAKHCELVLTKHDTDVECIAEHLGLLKSARTLLLIELAEEERRSSRPKSELHRYCHDLVRAANRRFYFFGDDSLNEKAIRYLAEMEGKSNELDQVVDDYRQSGDALYPLGSSKAMTALRRQIGRIGPLPEPVLVLGPTGSGKEVVARALHVTSGRKGSFVAVNCAVLGGNSTLVEDRLFGHVRGAYTGATAEGKGAFEEAHGGTLFLDEVGELPQEVQSQLLRVLEEKVVRPLGTMATRSVDVRIVGATHRNLARMVSSGTFREDLYYRLNVLAIRVPSIRERPEDMKSIAAHVGRELQEKGYPLKLGKADWDAIREFDWPGNVRQFLNVLKRAAYLEKPVERILVEEQTAGVAPEDDMQSSMRLYCPSTPDEVVPAAEVYQAYIRHVLRLFEGNVTRTAGALGIAQNTLRKRMEER